MDPKVDSQEGAVSEHSSATTWGHVHPSAISKGDGRLLGDAA